MSLDNSPFEDDDIPQESVTAFNENESEVNGVEFATKEDEEADMTPVVAGNDIPMEVCGNIDEGLLEKDYDDEAQGTDTEQTQYYSNTDIITADEGVTSGPQQMDINEAAITAVNDEEQEGWEEGKNYCIPDPSAVVDEAPLPLVEEDISQEQPVEEWQEETQPPVTSVEELISSEVLFHRLSSEVVGLKSEISQLYPELELLKGEKAMLEDKVKEITQIKDAANVCINRLEQALLEATSLNREGEQQTRKEEKTISSNYDNSKTVSSPTISLPTESVERNLIDLPPLDTIDLLAQIEELKRINLQQSNQLIMMSIERDKWKEEVGIHRQVTLGALAKRYDYLTIGVWEKENETGTEGFTVTSKEGNCCNDWVQRGKQLSLYFTSILSRPSVQLAETFANILKDNKGDSGSSIAAIQGENENEDNKLETNEKNTSLYSVKHLIDYVVACGYELEQQKLKLDAQRLRCAVGEVLYEQRRKRKVKEKMFSNSNAPGDSNDTSSSRIDDKNDFTEIFNSNARHLTIQKILTGVKRAREETESKQDESSISENFNNNRCQAKEAAATEALEIRDVYIEQLLAFNEKLISTLNVSLSMNNISTGPLIPDTRKSETIMSPIKPTPKGSVEVSIIALETLRNRLKQLPVLNKELIAVQNRLKVASKLASAPLSIMQTDDSAQELQAVYSHKLPSVLLPQQIYKEACALYYRRCVELTKVVFKSSYISSNNNKINSIPSCSASANSSSIVDKAVLEYQKCILKSNEERIKSLEASNVGLQAQLLAAFTLYFCRATEPDPAPPEASDSITNIEVIYSERDEAPPMLVSREEFNEWTNKFITSISNMKPASIPVESEGETEKTTTLESLPGELAGVLQKFFTDTVIPEANRKERRTQQYMAVLLKALLEADNFITDRIGVPNDGDTSQVREMPDNMKIPDDSCRTTTEQVRNLYQSIMDITTSTLPVPYSCPRIMPQSTILSAEVQRKVQNDLLPSLNKSFSDTLQKALSRVHKEQQLFEEEVNWLKGFVCKQLSDASSGTVDISETLLNDVINRKKELQESIQKLARTEMSRKNLEGAARKGAEDTKKLRAAEEKELLLTRRIKDLEQHLNESKHEVHKFECSLKEVQSAIDAQREQYESKIYLLGQQQEALIFEHQQQLQQQSQVYSHDILPEQEVPSSIPEGTYTDTTNAVSAINDEATNQEELPTENYDWDPAIEAQQDQGDTVNTDNIEDRETEHEISGQDHQEGMILEIPTTDDIVVPIDQSLVASSDSNVRLKENQEDIGDVPNLEASLNDDDDDDVAVNDIDYTSPPEYGSGGDDKDDDGQADVKDNEAEESGLGSVW